MYVFLIEFISPFSVGFFPLALLTFINLDSPSHQTIVVCLPVPFSYMFLTLMLVFLILFFWEERSEHFFVYMYILTHVERVRFIQELYFPRAFR